MELFYGISQRPFTVQKGPKERTLNSEWVVFDPLDPWSLADFFFDEWTQTQWADR